jgi:KipI family sensor histidine kinase inhibitor
MNRSLRFVREPAAVRNSLVYLSTVRRGRMILFRSYSHATKEWQLGDRSLQTGPAVSGPQRGCALTFNGLGCPAARPWSGTVSVRFLPSGDTALVIEFGNRVSRKLNASVLRLDAALREHNLPGVIETVPTFRSLCVHYDPLKTEASQLIRAIESLLGRDGGVRREATLWRVPVCYEGELAPDLTYVAERTGLDPPGVIALHCARRYHVYMLGFLPGFPYMGDLPAKLRLARRTDPRVKVPAGSVAIATSLTGIYPVESPGGWHLIGTTPIRLFDPTRPSPSLFEPGDQVIFQPVNRNDFEGLRSAVAGGNYQPPHEKLVL